MNNTAFREVVHKVYKTDGTIEQHGVYLLSSQIRLTPQIVERHQDKTFIFGDNLERVGTGGQAIVRGLTNTYGIRTKKSPRNDKASYFYDSDFIWFTTVVLEDFVKIQKLNQTSSIVFCETGYGNGLAKLPTQAPRCYKYLINHLNSYCKGNYFE